MRLRAFCICLAISLFIPAYAEDYTKVEGAVSFPQEEGQRARYNVQIDIRKAYISGICIMLNDEGLIKGSVVNEFGVSALSFSYSFQKDKVKILSVMKKMNRWYIRKVLKRDLREVIHLLSANEGAQVYNDEKFHITYNFTPLEDEAAE